MNTLNLSSPWVNYYRMINALFGNDPEIKIVFTENDNTIRLFVSNAAKADALTQLIPPQKTFGNVTLNVIVIPANEVDASFSSLFEIAFKDNPVFAFSKTVQGIMSNPISYVVFKNEVVQYYTDDLGDIYGNRSTLYQDIAKEVFGSQDGVFFCTDVEKKVGDK